MAIARPRTLEQAVAALADMPDATLLSGGTDLMVEITHGGRRPTDVVAMRRVEELATSEARDGTLHLGALVRYSTMVSDLADVAPGLAMAARSVGSPQIRNAGTLGGNLGTGSPAGDTLPWLLALDAVVHLASVRGARAVPIAEFLVGPKRTARASDEIITGATVPIVRGPQHTAKVGPRNAMVIAIASLSLILDRDHRRVRVGMGSVGPTPLGAATAAETLAEAMDWDRLACDEDAIAGFARGCAEAASPITDHRATADYRRHAIATIAERSLRRCLAA